MNKVLIAAAGTGSRSGLTYPKTLYKIGEVSMLVAIIRKTIHLDKTPTIIVSQEGHPLVKAELDKYDIQHELFKTTMTCLHTNDQYSSLTAIGNTTVLRRYRR